MRVTWQFTIIYDPHNSTGPYSIGVRTDGPEVVDAFGSLIQAPVARNDAFPDRLLQIELSEDDPRLQSLLESIERIYGWKPSKWFNIPREERSRYFGVRKNRKYTKKDLDQAAFLHFHGAEKQIASQKDGNEEQVEREIYVAEADHYQGRRTLFGNLMPFHGLCVTESLGSQLERRGLRGLYLEPVVILPAGKVRKPLLKLSSSVVAPRSLLPVVNEDGHQIEPNTEWSCYLDDGGYRPHEFKYRKADLHKFQDVDIAMSYERTGVTKARAFRWCIVSQRFRQVMAELKVPGVLYAPVRFAG